MSPSRSFRSLGTVLVAAAALCAAVPTAAQAAPQPTEAPIIFIWPVFDDDASGVMFLNTTREDYCTAEQVAFEQAFTAWLAGPMLPGTEPIPPEEPPGDVLLSGYENEVRDGVVVSRAAGSGLHAEFWAFDPGIVDEETLGVGPCLDTDAAHTLLAAGTGSIRINDNDLFGSGTRANAFGVRFHAELHGDDAHWLVTGLFHVAQNKSGTVHFTGHDQVVPRG